MTKKDYIKLANLIKEKATGNDYIFIDDLLDGLCTILEDDNPRFDRERFIAACRD